MPTPRLFSRLWLSTRHLQPTIRPFASSATMSSFSFSVQLPETGTSPSSSIPVYATPDLPKETLLSFPAFNIWLSTLHRSLSRQTNRSHEFHSDPYILRQINIQSVDYFKGGRVGFLKLKADVSNGNGESLPGSVFLRGGSVGMLVLLPYLPSQYIPTAH